MSTHKKFDYEGYEQVLKSIFDSILDEYWVHFKDINSLQTEVAKTYMWVAAALLGAYVAVFNFVDLTIFKAIPCWVFIFPALAVFLGIISFSISLYAIPDIGGYRLIKWDKMTNKAYEKLRNKDQYVNIDTLVELIKQINQANYQGKKTNRRRSRLLRCTFGLLIASLFCAIVFSFFLFNYNTISK